MAMIQSILSVFLLLSLFACQDMSNANSAQQLKSKAVNKPSAALTNPSGAANDNERVEPLAQSLSLVTRPSLQTFLENPSDDSKGLEYSLLADYAERHALKLSIIIAANEAEVFAAIDAGHADIALLGQPLSQLQAKDYPVSTPYMDITTQLIYRHGSGKPKSFEDLIGKRILVPKLQHYQDKFDFLVKHYPSMQWEFSEQSPGQLLQQVNRGNAVFALIGSHEFLALRSKYPRTRIAFDLYYPEGLSLLFSKKHLAHSMNDSLDPTNAEFKLSDNNNLTESINLFIEQSLQDGAIAHLLERYLGHTEDINPLGSMIFFKRVRQRLPHYQDLIEKVARDYDIDWRLLAAIAYQESHWNPNAKSPTGVRGMMMLTQKTATELGVENRLDLSQSLNGGAKYFRKMHRRLPSKIREPDRTWFALAAYNVGLGHIYDARKITEFHGNNPNRWADVKQYLPFLEREAWYKYTQYGFARGDEPVSYVQNIRHFHDLLEWRFPESDNKAAKKIKIEVKELQDILNKADLNKHPSNTESPSFKEP